MQIYSTNYIRKNVYVGGGEKDTKAVECYDAAKNKWTSLSDTTEDHRYRPIIWNDDTNIIIIGSMWGSNTFEKIDIRENKWNDYMINNKTFNNLFGTHFEIEKDNSRLLLDLK